MVEMAARAGAGPLELIEGAGGVGKQNSFGVQKGMRARGVLVVSLSRLNSSSFFPRRARAPPHPGGARGPPN